MNNGGPFLHVAPVAAGAMTITTINNMITAINNLMDTIDQLQGMLTTLNQRITLVDNSMDLQVSLICIIE